MDLRVTYHDKWLRIISYPLLGFVLRHFGEYESIGALMKTGLYYADLAWNTLLVAATWEANRKLILYLDKVSPWQVSKFRRFAIESSLTILISVPIVAAMIYVWNEVIIERPNNFDTGYLLVYDFPLTIVFTTLVHMIYTGMYFQQYYTTTIYQLRQRIDELERPQNIQLSKDNAASRNVLILNYGTSSVPVASENVAYIYKLNELSFVRTLDAKEYTSSASLDNLEKLLPPETFFRVNRQMLANLHSIKQFRPDATGKLVLEVQPSPPEQVTVSRKKAGEFKEWIGKRV
jgi:hypothetical protein